MLYLHIVIMAIGLILLLLVFFRDEWIYVFQVQSKYDISKSNANKKTKSCLNTNSYHYY